MFFTKNATYIFNVSTMSRRNNANANVLTVALAVVTMVNLTTLSVFLLKLSPKSNINHK